MGRRREWCGRRREGCEEVEGRVWGGGGNGVGRRREGCGM